MLLHVDDGGDVEPETAPSHVADRKYVLGTTVPENWIPFMPAHVSGSVREIQLQRSRMLRIIQGASQPPPKVAPRTTLMREGLDVPPPNQVALTASSLILSGALLFAGGIDYREYDRLTRTYVNEAGRVDYAGLKRELPALESFVYQLAATSPDNRPELFVDAGERLRSPALRNTPPRVRAHSTRRSLRPLGVQLVYVEERSASARAS